MSYSEKEKTPGPKKLLALDGGGIRGVITLEVLGAMETCCDHVAELSQIGKALSERELTLDPFDGFL